MKAEETGKENKIARVLTTEKHDMLVGFADNCYSSGAKRIFLPVLVTPLPLHKFPLKLSLTEQHTNARLVPSH